MCASSLQAQGTPVDLATAQMKSTAESTVIPPPGAASFTHSWRARIAPQSRSPGLGLGCRGFAVLGDFVSFPPASVHSQALPLLKACAKEAESPAGQRVLGQSQLQLG